MKGTKGKTEPGRASSASGLSARLPAFLFFFAFFLSSFPAVAPAQLDYYGQEVTPTLSSIEFAALENLLATVKGREGKPLKPDYRVVLAARKMAEHIQSRPAAQDKLLSSSHLTKVLREFGVYETSIRRHLIYFATVDDIKTQLGLRFSDVPLIYTHAGLGAVPPTDEGASGVVLVIFVDRRAELKPFPRKVPVPSVQVLQGELVNSSRGHEVHVYLTLPSGEVKSLPVNAKGDFFTAKVPIEQGSGLYQLEVVSRKDGFAQVAALLEIIAGSSAENRKELFQVSASGSEPLTEEEAEAEMVRMINQVRKKAGLPELREDARLREMAKEHSRDMKENRFVGHLSPSRGSKAERAAQAGLEDVLLLENVAQNQSLKAAMDSLLQSPAHRVAIMNPEVNAVGVGVVFDYSDGSKHYYITQEFARLD